MSYVAWEFPQRLGWQNESLVLMIWAYYDESGEHVGGDIVNMTVAGCVSTSEKWAVFDAQWRDFLASEGLSEFHMTDFEAWVHPFNFTLPGGGRDKEKHNRVLNGVLNLMLEHIEGFYAYGAVSMLYSERKQTHGQFMNDCMSMAVKDVVLRVWGDYEEPINLMFAKQNHFSSTKIDRYVEIWNHGFNAGRVGSVTHCFASKVPALQAADVLAYEVARAQRPNRPERYPFQRLVDGAKAAGKAFSLTWGPIRSKRAVLSGEGESWG